MKKSDGLANPKTPIHRAASLPKPSKNQRIVSFMSLDSFVLTSATIMTCPHGGSIHHKPTYVDYLINGATIWLQYDQFIISCPLNGFVRCNRVRWHPDTEWMINGGFILSNSANVEVFAGSLWMGIGLLHYSQTTVTVKQLADYLMQKKGK
jgi:hypothetical protein